jgi:hypothetical protein
MGFVTTEALLNVVWAVLCLSALAAYFVRERDWRFKRAVCVLIASVALFPIVSASDDRMNLAALLNPQGPESTSVQAAHPQKPSLSPGLEDPEHGQTPDCSTGRVLPVAIALLAPEQFLGLATGSSSSPQGRAPPLSPARA